MVHFVRDAAIPVGLELRLDTLLRAGPFHAALRTAIRARGLPLDRLQSRLAEQGIQVGLSSLSDWQHGRARPEHANSLRAVEALEGILGLPPSALITLLAGNAPHRARPQQGIDEYSGPLGELLDGLPGSRAWDLEVLSLEHVVCVDARRRPAKTRCRSLVRARRDGVDRSLMRYFGSPDCAIDDVVVRAVRNCRVGRIRRHRAGRVLVTELLFGQALHTGETWVFETELVDRTVPPRNEFAHGFRHPEAQYLLEIRFHPAALPARCYAYSRQDLYAESHHLANLPLNSHHSVHLAATDVPTGVLGIAWDWP